MHPYSLQTVFIKKLKRTIIIWKHSYLSVIIIIIGALTLVRNRTVKNCVCVCSMKPGLVVRVASGNASCVFVRRRRRVHLSWMQRRDGASNHLDYSDKFTYSSPFCRTMNEFASPTRDISVILSIPFSLLTVWINARSPRFNPQSHDLFLPCTSRFITLFYYRCYLLNAQV